MASQGFLRRTLGPDVIIPLIVVAAVAFLLLPLPGVLLDGALVISFGAAAFHLATVADAPTARTLAGFGSLTTGLVLLRTALAFAVTRRILAGEPPEGLVFALGASLSPFGPAAGLAVLAALALVHLTVVARGVERAAQVAARFALDALPGRQLALESAGRMGEADPDTLRRRRAALGAAAERAGTMDAAARFLRGEATALLALVVLDAVAGVAVPVLSRDVPFTEAWRAPLAAAAGAGLATLLPALLSGVAVGLFTARPGPSATADPVSGPSGSTREGPAPAWAAAATCALLGALPGAPIGPAAFGVLGFVALAMDRRSRGVEAADGPPPACDTPSIGLVLHPDALTALGPEGLDEAVSRVERGLTHRHGLGPTRIARREAPALPPGGFHVEVAGTPVARGRLRGGAGLSLAAPPSANPLDRHPTLGLPAAWVEGGPLSPVDVLAAALDAALRRTPGALLSIDVVSERLDAERRVSPARVAAVCPARVDLPGLTRLLAALLAEDVPLAPLGRLLEALARAPSDASATDDDRLRILRRALADTTSARYAPTGELEALCVEGRLEEHLLRTNVLTPGQADAVYDGLGRHLRAGPTFVLFVSPETRSIWARLIHPRFPGVPVLSAEDLRPDIRVRPVGLLGA
jgi:flagellar biosynthesis component FlhA